MGWLAPFQGATIGLDTAPLIYYIEQYPPFYPIVRPFFEALALGSFRVVTSTVALAEVLVHPYRRGEIRLAQNYRDILLRSQGITTLPVSEDIVDESARLRAQYNLRTPDALQLATAIIAGATFWLTNDVSFRRVPDVNVILVADLAGTGTTP